MANDNGGEFFAYLFGIILIIAIIIAIIIFIAYVIVWIAGIVGAIAATYNYGRSFKENVIDAAKARREVIC